MERKEWIPQGFHELAGNGRFSACWHEDGSVVKLFCKTAKHWQYVLEEDATLSQIEEIAESFGDLTPEDWQFLVSAGQSIEHWLELAPYDLERYGEVGVSG